MSSLQRELVAIAAGPEAERLWWECELGHVGTMPAVHRESSQGDAYAFDYVLSRFRCADPTRLHRESRLLALVLLDDYWLAVQRLVEALCRCPLPVALSGRMVEAIVR